MRAAPLLLALALLAPPGCGRLGPAAPTAAGDLRASAAGGELVVRFRTAAARQSRMTALGLKAVRREGNTLVAVLGSDFAAGWREERRVDQVVVEHGTLPLDELYLALKPKSKNRGAVDYEKLVGGGEVFPVRDAAAAFTLLRIGDAVASRNIHAAVYDGIRFGIRI